MDSYCSVSALGPAVLEMLTWQPLDHLEHELSLLLSNDASAGDTVNVNEPHPSPSGCFAFTSEQEIAKLYEGLVPQNTAKMTSWALKNFQDWMRNRNQCNPADPVPDDILQCVDPVVLNNQLPKVCR